MRFNTCIREGWVDESDLPASAFCWSAVTHIVGDPWGQDGKHEALKSDKPLDHKLIPKVIPLCNEEEFNGRRNEGSKDRSL